MADKISEIYQKAKEKGIFKDGYTEDMFRKETSSDEGLRSYYDYATTHGMKYHDYDTFKSRFYGEDNTVQQSGQSGQAAATANQAKTTAKTTAVDSKKTQSTQPAAQATTSAATTQQAQMPKFGMDKLIEEHDAFGEKNKSRFYVQPNFFQAAGIDTSKTKDRPLTNEEKEEFKQQTSNIRNKHAQEVYDRRYQNEEPEKPKDNFAKDAFENVMSGIGEIALTPYKAVEAIEDFSMDIDNWLFGSNLEHGTGAVTNFFNTCLGGDYLKSRVEHYRKESDRYQDDTGITEDLFDGKAGTAVGKAVLGTLQSAPNLAVSIYSGKKGYETLGGAFLGATAALSKYDEIKDDDSIDAATKALDVFGAFVSECVPEIIGAKRYGRMFNTKTVGTVRREVQEETTKGFQSFLNHMRKGGAKVWNKFMDWFGEGATEAMTDVMNLAIDKALGIKDEITEKDIMSIGDSFIIGQLSDLGPSSAHLVQKGVYKKNVKDEIESDPTLSRVASENNVTASEIADIAVKVTFGDDISEKESKVFDAYKKAISKNITMQHNMQQLYEEVGIDPTSRGAQDIMLRSIEKSDKSIEEARNILQKDENELTDADKAYLEELSQIMSRDNEFVKYAQEHNEELKPEQQEQPTQEISVAEETVTEPQAEQSNQEPRTIVTDGKPVNIEVSYYDKDNNLHTEKVRYVSKEYAREADGQITNIGKFRIVKENGQIVKSDEKQKYMDAINIALKQQEEDRINREAIKEEQERIAKEAAEKAKQEKEEKESEEAKVLESIQYAQDGTMKDRTPEKVVVSDKAKHGADEALNRVAEKVRYNIKQRAALRQKFDDGKVDPTEFYEKIDKLNDDISGYKEAAIKYLDPNAGVKIDAVIKETEDALYSPIEKAQEKAPIAQVTQTPVAESNQVEQKIEQPTQQEEVQQEQQTQEEPVSEEPIAEEPIAAEEPTPVVEQQAPEQPAVESVEPVNLEGSDIKLLNSRRTDWTFARITEGEDGKVQIENLGPVNRKITSVKGYDGAETGWKEVDKDSKLVYLKKGDNEYIPYYLLSSYEVKVDKNGNVISNIPATEGVKAVRADEYRGVVENIKGIYVKDANGNYVPLHSKVEEVVPQSAETVLDTPIFQNSKVKITLRQFFAEYNKHFAEGTKKDNPFVNALEAIQARLDLQTQDEKSTVTRELVGGIRKSLEAWNAFAKEKGIDRISADELASLDKSDRDLLSYVRFVMYKHDSVLAERPSLLVNENGNADVFSKKNITNPIYQLEVALYLAQKLNLVSQEYVANIPTIPVKRVVTRAEIKKARDNYNALKNGEIQPNYDMYQGNVQKALQDIELIYPEVTRDEELDHTRLAYTNEELQEQAKKDAPQEEPITKDEIEIVEVESTPTETVQEQPIEEDELEEIKEKVSLEEQVEELVQKLRVANENHDIEKVGNILDEIREKTADRPELFTTVVESISKTAPVKEEEQRKDVSSMSREELIKRRQELWDNEMINGGLNGKEMRELTAIEEALGVQKKFELSVVSNEEETEFDKKFKKIGERLDKGGSNVLSLQEISDLTDALEDDLRQGHRPLVFERIPLEVLQSGIKEQRTLAEALTIATIRSRRTSRALERDGKEVTGEERASRDASNTQMELDLMNYAKEKGLWLDNPIAFLNERYGEQIGEGQESRVWADNENGTVVKAKATSMYETAEEFFEGMLLNNWLFEGDKQQIVGFGYDGDGMFRVIYSAPYVQLEDAAELSREEVEEFMTAHGFKSINESGDEYTNGAFEVLDLHGQNIVKDSEGVVRCVDPIIKWSKGEHYRMPTEREEIQDAENEERLDRMFEASITPEERLKKAHSQLVYRALNMLLTKAKGIKLHYAGDQENARRILKSVEDIELFKAPNGTILGWAIGNEIYLTDEGLNSDTPIHEYTHLWVKSLRAENPKAWKKIVDMLKKNTALWEEVKKDKNYSDLASDDEIASEALSRFSGREGAKRLEKIAKELYTDTESGDKLAQAFINRVKKALNLFWENVVRHVWNFGAWIANSENTYDKAKLNRISTIEGVADMVLRDLFDVRELNLNEAVLEKEMADIKSKAIAEGTFMKAPNGEPTNLTEKQWLLVRTKAFKKWFGDWENDPYGASKVVDKNGEPLVVYHGTIYAGFDKFKYGQGYSKSIYATENKAAAATYMLEDTAVKEQRDAIIEADKHYGMYSLFMNLRTPLFVDFSDEEGKSRHWTDYPTGRWIVNLAQYGIEEQVFNSEAEAWAFVDEKGIVPTKNELHPETISTDDIVEEAKRLGFDGCVFTNVYDGNYSLGKEMTDYVAFQPNQLKSATKNKGFFSIEDDRIQFSTSMDALRNCDSEQILKNEECKKKASRIMSDRTTSEIVKRRKLMDLAIKMHDQSAGMRAILLSINAWRREQGLGKLDGKFDIRTIFEATQSRIGNKVVALHHNISRKLDDSIDKLAKVVKKSEFYKQHSTNTWRDDNGEEHTETLSPVQFIERYLMARNNWERAKEGTPRGLREFMLRMKMGSKEFVDAFHDAFASTKKGEDMVTALWDNIREMTDFALDTNHDAGLIPDATYERLKAKQFYIPQRGFWDDANKETQVKDEKGKEQIVVDLSRRGKAKNKLDSMHKAEGGKSLAEGGLAYIYRDAEEAIKMAEENYAKRVLFDLLREHPEWCKAVGFEVPKRIDFYTKEDGSIGVLQDDFTEEQIKEMREQMRETQAIIAELKKQLLSTTDEETKKDIQSEIDAQYEQLPYFDDKDTYRILHAEYIRNRATVGVWVDGVLCKMTMPPTMLYTADAYNGRRDKTLEVEVMRTFGGWLAAQLTMNNVTFAPVNIVRDVPFVLQKGTTEYGPLFTARFLKNFVLSKGVIFKYLSSVQFSEGDIKIEDSDRGELFRDFLDYGANTGFFTLPELQQFRDRAHRMSSLSEQGVSDWRLLARVGQYFNEYSELITRFSIYRSIIEMGLGREEAVKAAHNLSVNFNRRGLGVWFMNMFNTMSIFANATIQGATGLWRTFYKDGTTKEKAQHFARAFTYMAFVPAFLGFLNTLLIPDDDDDEIKISDYTRDNYIILPFGGRVHLNEALRPFWCIGVNAAMMCRGQRTWKDAIDSFFTQAATYWLPLPQNATNAVVSLKNSFTKGESPWQAVRDLFTPTPLATVGQLADNKNFLGGKLRYDFGSNPEYLVSNDEAKLMRDISYGWFLLTGGDPDLDIAVDRWGNEMGELRDVNPKEVRNMLFWVPSGTLDLASLTWAVGSDIKDRIKGEYTGTNIRMKDIPVANRFIGKSDKNVFRYGIIRQARALVKKRDENIKQYEAIIAQSYDILNSEYATESERKRAERALKKAQDNLIEEQNDVPVETMKEFLNAMQDADMDKFAKNLLESRDKFKRLHPDIPYSDINDIDKFIVQNLLYNINLKNGLQPDRKNPQWIDWFDDHIRLPLKEIVNPSKEVTYEEKDEEGIDRLVVLQRVEDGKFNPENKTFDDKYVKQVGFNAPEEISEEEFERLKEQKSDESSEKVSGLPTILWNGYNGRTRNGRRRFRKSLDGGSIYERIGEEWVPVE